MAEEVWTLAEAQEMVQQCMAGIKAVMINQSYTIGNRTYTRASLKDLQQQLQFWRGEVQRLSAGRSAGASLHRVVPRDW